MKNKRSTRKWPKSIYVYSFIFAVILTQIIIVFFRPVGDDAISSGAIESTFAANFIEWFGVLYSILLPLILVRVWEQLDDIDREFDREADVVRNFFEDLSFFSGENEFVRKKLSLLLREYVRHVTKNYPREVKSAGNARTTGDKILIKIRKQIRDIISSNMMENKNTEFLVKELFQRLNEIVDIRGDRIGYASQRLFDMFRFVALIVSIIFIVPFYVVGFTTQTSALDYLLIIAVTFLVIFVYMIIDDFDEPFGGTWKIDDESWHQLRFDMVCEERNSRAIRISNQKGNTS